LQTEARAPRSSSRCCTSSCARPSAAAPTGSACRAPAPVRPRAPHRTGPARAPWRPSRRARCSASSSKALPDSGGTASKRAGRKSACQPGSSARRGAGVEGDHAEGRQLAAGHRQQAFPATAHVRALPSTGQTGRCR
jgi:hypothetical protein